MSLFDGLLAKAGSVDLGALAGQVGLEPDQLKTGFEAMLGKLAGGTADAQEAATHAEATTGIPADKLMALLPALAQSLGAHDHPDGPLAGLTEKLGGAGLMGSVTGALGGLFGKG